MIMRQTTPLNHPDRSVQGNYLQEHVILLHGLARTYRSMNKLANILERAGYQIVNQPYPSTRLPIEKLAEMALSKAILKCQGKGKIHIVAHSLGCILARHYFQKGCPDRLGRVVMLGPPNQGSEIADKLGHLSLYKFINGPAGNQLGTSTSDLPQSLGPVNFETGIIAGNRSINPILSTMLPGANDGKVAVERSRIEGASDHITLPVTHTFMMRNNIVTDQVLAFLHDGKFKQTQ